MKNWNINGKFNGISLKKHRNTIKNLYKYQAMRNALSHQGLKGREGLGSVKPGTHEFFGKKTRGFLWEMAVFLDINWEGWHSCILDFVFLYQMFSDVSGL